MREFNANDRCDRCGAQASAEARKPGHTSLLFCGHHHREFEDALLDDLWTIVSGLTDTDEPTTAPVYTE